MYETIDSIPQNLLIAIYAVLKAGYEISNDFDDRLILNNQDNEMANSLPNKTDFSFWSKGQQQIVTPTDIKADQIIKDIIATYCGNYCIISEEAGRVHKVGNPPYSWIVDPLDGTTNFSQTIPIFVTSIALVDNASGEPILAAVYNPLTTELFTSYRNEGSYLHLIKKIPGIDITHINLDQLPSQLVHPKVFNKLHCETIKMPNKENIIDTGSSLPHSDYLARLAGLTKQPGVENLRDYSSAIYIACKIAQGNSIILSNANDLHLWDIVPSVLLISEAGGAVTNIQGQDNRLCKYIQTTLTQYLASANYIDEAADTKLKFAESVANDKGTMIAACSVEVLFFAAQAFCNEANKTIQNN